MAGNEEPDSSAIPSHCFLRISVAGGPPQTVVIELHTDRVPVTCRNFARLCSTEKGVVTSRKQPLPTYRGTEFHRIVPGFMVQGGDFEKFDGTGGYSSYGGGTFADENLQTLHSGPFLVSMANRGPNTNGSQFFVTLQATPHLNGKHVVFGEVVEGMDVVQEMARVELDGTRPMAMQRIVVVDCGVGRGTVVRQDSDSSSRHANKEKKRKKNHRSKRRKRDSHHSDDNSSNSSSDERHRRKKKRKRSSGHNDSDSKRSSTERHHRRRRHYNRNIAKTDTPNETAVHPGRI